MRVLKLRTALPLLPFLLACGGDDAADRDTTRAPSTRDDASATAADGALNGDAGASTGTGVDAGGTSANTDAGGARADGSLGSDAGAPAAPLTLERALDATGIDSTTERAMLVIDAACKARVPCGQGGTSLADCVDVTLNEWALGALFFSEECVDAQIDLYACLATPACDAEAGCAERRAAQATLCAMEQ